MKKRLLALLVLCVMLFCVSLPCVAAADLLPANGRIAALEQALEGALGKDTPGAAVALVKKGQIELMEGYGYADMVSRVLVAPDTSFELGALSGFFVAMAAYQLAEQGRLDPEADIATYLPDDFMSKLALSSPVSVKHLLCSVAGFEGRSFDLVFDKSAYLFDDLEQALLADVPGQFAVPGEIYSYSPFGIALAAYVIEQVTGERYESFVTANILTPLGMNDTLLFVNAESHVQHPASGHAFVSGGSFTVPHNAGRSYFALYPADGALSTLADLSTLLCFLTSESDSPVLSLSSRAQLLDSSFQNGVFGGFGAVLCQRGSAVGLRTATPYFSLSFWLERESGEGALVLCNTADSCLLRFPETLAGAQLGVAVGPSEELIDPEEFEGAYISDASERRSFVGRLWRRDHTEQAVLEPDGTLSFLGLRLRQIAPGVFADAEREGNVALVQFLTDEKGDVVSVLTADGRSFSPAPFYEQGLVSTVLFYAVLGFSVWFFFAGPVAYLRWRRWRDDHDSGEGLRFVFPNFFAMLMSVCAMLQILVGWRYGGAAFSSFFDAMAVLMLLFGIGAMGSFLFAFVTSLTEKKIFLREIHTAFLFVGFVLLIVFWGMVPV